MNLANDRDSNVLAAAEALGGTFDAPKMTPHPRPLPPLPPMRQLDVEPVEQGPHGPDPDALLWTSPERLAAIKRAEAIDAAETYQERQRREDEERHRAGVRRMLEAERRYRDHRDQEDEERRR
jgi:hypothetical protein